MEAPASKEELLLVPEEAGENESLRQGRRDPQHSPSPTETTSNTLSTCSSSPHHLDNNKSIVENLGHNGEEDVNNEDRKNTMKATGNQSSTTTRSTASTSTMTLASTPATISDQELQHNHQSTLSSFLTHAKGYWNNLEEEAEFPQRHPQEGQKGGVILDGCSKKYAYSHNQSSDDGGDAVAASASANLQREISCDGQTFNNLHSSKENSQPATLHPTSIQRRALAARVSSNNSNKSMTRFELAQHEVEQKIRQQATQKENPKPNQTSAYPFKQAKESSLPASDSGSNDAATSSSRIGDQFILQRTMAKTGSGGDVINSAAGDLSSVTNAGFSSVLKEEVTEGNALAAAENSQDASYPSQQAKTIHQLTAMESQGSDEGAFQWRGKEGSGQESKLISDVIGEAHMNLSSPGTSFTEGNQDVTNQGASEKQDENQKNCTNTANTNISNCESKAQPEQIQPGAYSQAPGKNCRRNRSIRNSVISQHSMSAQMSRSGDLFGSSCPDLGFRMSANSNIGNASFSTMSASYNSRDGPRISPRRRNRTKKKRSSFQSKQSKQSINEEIVSEDDAAAGETSSADFYERIPDYSTKKAALPVEDHKGEQMHEQQMAAMLSNLLEFSSDEEDKGVYTGLTSSRPPARGQGKHKTRSGSEQSDHTTNNSPTTSVSSARAPSPPSSPPIKRIRHTKRCISGRSQVSEISNMTEEDTSLDFIIGSPQSSAADPWIGASDVEEEKEEIASAGNNSGGDLSTVGSLSDIPHRTKRIAVPRNESDNPTQQGGSGVGAAREQIRQQQPPTARKVPPPQRTPNYGFTNTRRFFNLSAYGGGGSVHSRQRRKLSLLSENSSTLGDFSSGSGSMLSLTDLKSRTSSTVGSSSVATTTTTTMAARQSAGRIARNLSLYMRAGALPVAATVVGDDAFLESELRRQLESEIRKELEIEMEEFRRQIVLQVVGAAEPVTANVISINSSRQQLVLPPREEETLGSEMSVDLASLQASLRERERREAAAVRSSMNRELGRMYVDMKRSQRAHFNDQDRLFGLIAGIDNSYEEVFDDEEMQMEGSTKITHRDEPNGGTTWRRVWVGMIVALLSGVLLGMGIMAAAQ